MTAQTLCVDSKPPSSNSRNWHQGWRLALELLGRRSLVRAALRPALNSTGLKDTGMLKPNSARRRSRQIPPHMPMNRRKKATLVLLPTSSSTDSDTPLRKACKCLPLVAWAMP